MWRQRAGFAKLRAMNSPASAPACYANPARWALWLIVLTWILIVIGGATRVWDAGLSCPDWPHCYGLWWPWPESRVTALNGVGYVVQGVHYSAFQVALEWGHRLLAALVGGVLLITLGVSAWQRTLRAAAVPFAVAIGLLLIQIKLGAVTVWLGNIHWSVAIHLGNAMLFLAALVWLRRRLALAVVSPMPSAAPQQASAAITAALVGFAALVWATMLAGGMTSSAHAGGVCGGLFSCAGEWFPGDFQQALHMVHRALALLVVAASVGLLIGCKRKAPHLRPMALRLHLIMWGQVALGIATLYSFSLYPAVYYYLSVAHLAWGTLLFMAAIGAVLAAVHGNTGRFHG